MKKKLTFWEAASIMSMLFGLFFGAGNLIFPAYLGQLAGRNVWKAVAGFSVTGVGLPLLAVAALAITESSGVLMLSKRVGRKFAYLFTCGLYLTIGPFFACPRCVTVPFEVGVRRMLPAGFDERLALFLFSLLFLVLILWFSLRPGNILTWIGKILNPIFFVVLGILVFSALLRPAGTISQYEPLMAYKSGAVIQGILDGYNTMDALAGLAFGIIVVDVVKKQGIREPKYVALNTIMAGLTSCLLMAVIYVLVALMGAGTRGYAELAENGGTVLADAAAHYFPSFGSVLLTLIVSFACLKTAIGLVTSCSTCFQEMFPGKLRYNQWAVLFSVITASIANVGLSSIIKVTIPVLMMLYPLSITLIIIAFGGTWLEKRPRVVHCLMGATFLSAIFDFIKAMPSEWIAATHAEPLIEFLKSYLPFFKLGFGWVCPTILGFLVGLLLSSKKTA